MESPKLLILEDPITTVSKIIKIDPPSRHQLGQIPIRSLITKELKSQITDLPYYYALVNGKLLASPSVSWDKLDQLNLVKIYFPLRGGNVIGTLINCVVNIGKFFFIVLQFIEWFFKFIAWLFTAAFWALEILNPMNVIGDFTNTIKMIANQIVLAPLQAIVAFIKLGFNKFFGAIFGSFWGWDNKPDDYESEYYKKTQKNKKCYVQNQKTPFSVILGTIFCPPVGVFMELGLSGWFHILLATLLTFAYYIPGLLYALLVIYN
jgi:uncharacterized membrane protein YqaE (UPF0057 family)